LEIVVCPQVLQDFNGLVQVPCQTVRNPRSLYQISPVWLQGKSFFEKLSGSLLILFSVFAFSEADIKIGSRASGISIGRIEGGAIVGFGGLVEMTALFQKFCMKKKRSRIPRPHGCAFLKLFVRGSRIAGFVQKYCQVEAGFVNFGILLDDFLV